MDIKFEPQNVQIAFFLTDSIMNLRVKIAVAISDFLPDKIGDFDPVLVPVGSGQDVPDDFPIMIMDKKSTGWRIQLGKSRFDLFIDPAVLPYSGDFDKVMESIKTEGLKLWNELSERFNLKANRMGFITWNIAKHPSPIEFLCKKHLQIDSADIPETHIEYIRRIEISPFKLNKWTKLRGVINEEQNLSILFLENDINTNPEQVLDFTPELTNQFIDLANRLSQETLNQYSKND